MKTFKLTHLKTILVSGIIFLLPLAGMCCEACRGNPDSSLTEGMNMAIITLLGITGSVLGGFASFFVFLLKRMNKSV